MKCCIITQLFAAAKIVTMSPRRQKNPVSAARMSCVFLLRWKYFNLQSGWGGCLIEKSNDLSGS